MIATACALLSAAGFYFSLGLGNQWWLAWIAPVPVLWFAFGPAKPWTAFLAAFAGPANISDERGARGTDDRQRGFATASRQV